MKALALILSLWCSKALAVDLQFAWDASPTPGVTNYIFYAHTNVLSPVNLTPAVVKKAVGTNLTVKLEGITGLWFFTVTAVKDGMESDPAEFLIGTWAIPQKAERPNNIRMAEAYAGPQPNVYLTKYFRMRWP